MVKNKSKKLKSKKGGSIILAVLLLLVITLFCSSLFYIMSSSTRNAAQEKDREQSLLLAQSLSVLVQEEVEDQNSTLYSYLKDNIGKGWTYYNPDEIFNSNKDRVTRTFTSSVDQDGLGADVKLSMYWCSDSESEVNLKEGKDVDRTLYVTVTVQMKDAKSAASSVISVFDYVKDPGTSTYHWEYRGAV